MYLISYYFNINLLFFSFKEILRNITSTKDSTFKFLQERSCLKKDMVCPGPLFKGKLQSVHATETCKR